MDETADGASPALALGTLYFLTSHRGLGHHLLPHTQGHARVFGLEPPSLGANRHSTSAIGVYHVAGITIIREAVIDIACGFVMDDDFMVEWAGHETDTYHQVSPHAKQQLKQYSTAA